MQMSTGFPQADVENEFLRARRRRALARLAGRLRRQPAERSLIRTLGEVTDELGWRGQGYLGLQTIRLDTIPAQPARAATLTTASGPPPT
jgi:hypothetical protein